MGEDNLMLSNLLSNNSVDYYINEDRFSDFTSLFQELNIEDKINLEQITINTGGSREMLDKIADKDLLEYLLGYGNKFVDCLIYTLGGNRDKFKINENQQNVDLAYDGKLIAKVFGVTYSNFLISTDS